MEKIGGPARNCQAGVCSVWCTRFQVDHLLCITVVRRDEQNVPRLLACIYMVPTPASVFVMASTAASYTPVCPTYKIMPVERTIQPTYPLKNEEESVAPYLEAQVAHDKIVLRLSDNPGNLVCTLILGSLSYVAILGDGIRCLSLLSNCFSTPPLKKRVKCAYFSVSA